MHMNSIKNVSLVRGQIIFEEGAFNNEATPPIGLAYLAGILLAKNYSVNIIDGIGEGLNKINPIAEFPGFFSHGLSDEEIVNRIPSNTHFIGFTAMFSGEWPQNRILLNKIRAKFPNALLVIGGEHATALPEYVLNDCKAVDYVVLGEGERVLASLIEAINNGESVSELQGIAYITDGVLVKGNTNNRLKNLDDIPWPYWPEGLLEKYWEAGKSHGVLTERDMPMIASRGCPYRCTFCSNPQMWTTRYVLREPSEVIREIKYYKDKYDITSVQFYDLTAITKRDWIIRFCNELMRQDFKINWSLPAGTRSEVLDVETLTLVKKSGCHYLVYAPESGSESTLIDIKKRITLSKLTDSIKIAKKVGIVLRANLVLGFPSESRMDIWKTLAYGMKLSWLGVDEVAMFLFSAYPGSELFNQLHSAGEINLGDKYFLELTSLNGKFNTLKPKTYNKNVYSSELAIYRTTGMLMAYLIGYLRYPKRIYRTFLNVFIHENSASTVLEHRLKDAIALFKLKKS